jgi:hypothetical protein
LRKLILKWAVLLKWKKSSLYVATITCRSLQFTRLLVLFSSLIRSSIGCQYTYVSL